MFSSSSSTTAIVSDKHFPEALLLVRPALITGEESKLPVLLLLLFTATLLVCIFSTVPFAPDSGPAELAWVKFRLHVPIGGRRLIELLTNCRHADRLIKLLEMKKNTDLGINYYRLKMSVVWSAVKTPAQKK